MNLITVADSIEMVGREFNKHFGTRGQQFKMFMDPLLTVVRSKFDLDIIKFDDWLHEQGYTEKEHGSMRDFIQIKYGKGAVELIERLIKVKIARVQYK